MARRVVMEPIDEQAVTGAAECDHAGATRSGWAFAE